MLTPSSQTVNSLVSSIDEARWAEEKRCSSSPRRASQVLFDIDSGSVWPALRTIRAIAKGSVALGIVTCPKEDGLFPRKSQCTVAPPRAAEDPGPSRLSEYKAPLHIPI